MFSRRSISMSSPRSRRWITALALLAYVASVVGYPLPLPAGDQKRDASAPYPCQDHACGCNSAAQCWESCCCYSPAQRLAWVRRHGVALPAATLAALTSAAENEDDEHATKSCCQRKSKPTAHSSCGQCNDTAACDHASDSQARSIRFNWINAIQAQKCQGLTTLWLVSGANLPVEIADLWEFDWAPAGCTVVSNDTLLSRSDRPDVPPPCA
jgi:hypothetical protein